MNEFDSPSANDHRPSQPMVPGNATYGPPPPMPFSVVLDRVFHLLRAHLRLFIAIGAVPAAGFFILYGLMFALMAATLPNLFHPQTTPNPEAIQSAFRFIFPLALLLTIPASAIAALYLGAAFHAATRADAGIPVTFREAYATVWHRLGRNFLLLICIYLRAFGPVIAIFLCLFGGIGLFTFGHPNPNPSPSLLALIPLAVLLLLASYIYGFIIAMCLALAFPASIVEDLPVLAAMDRSSHLTRGAKGRIFLILLVLYAIGYAAMFVLEILALLLGAVVFLAGSALHIHLAAPWIVILAILGIACAVAFFFVWMCLLYGSFVTALSVLYHDQRRRMETPPPAPAPISLPPGEPA